ncbi:hypothetical protein M218_04765 [Burkholderia pseudomallei MSHR338]|nr:hypothetical protein M218_04765 [Burkholderia pseudomallei MSHR338]
MARCDIARILSRRSILYADLGYARDGAGDTLGIQYTAPVSKAGLNQFGAIVGMRTTF